MILGLNLSFRTPLVGVYAIKQFSEDFVCFAPVDFVNDKDVFLIFGVVICRLPAKLAEHALFILKTNILIFLNRAHAFHEIRVIVRGMELHHFVMLPHSVVIVTGH